MHLSIVAEALHYFLSEEGGSLLIHHTQVSRAAKANATWDGYAFTYVESHILSLCVYNM